MEAVIGVQHGFYARPRLRLWSIVWLADSVRSVVAFWFATPRTPPLWQRNFFLVNCLVLRRLLASVRSGVVKTSRCTPRLMSDQPTNDSAKTSRHRLIAVTVMSLGLLSVPFYLFFHRHDLEIMQIVVGTIGVAIAIYWAPLNLYVGFRAGDRFEQLCALFAFMPCAFWIWWFVTN